jgi:hypothetical protein
MHFLSVDPAGSLVHPEVLLYPKHTGKLLNLAGILCPGALVPGTEIRCYYPF